MMEDLKISQAEIAFLSSAVNVGLAIATLVVSPVMSILKTKHVLVITQLMNASASLLFAVSSNYTILTTARFLLGFTQAFVFVYAPVWINEFAPKGNTTKWMAFNQAFCAIGVITGYGVGAMIVDGVL
jgi:MFS transporter, Spinster family, sphingosine-1-phosphate transporter